MSRPRQSVGGPIDRQDINMSDDSESDGDVENNKKTSSNQQESKNTSEQPEELIVRKKARNYKPFTEDILVHPLGLQRLYEEFPQSFRCTTTYANKKQRNNYSGGSNCSEAKDLKRLLSMYKDWAFQLHPGLSFKDVLSKIEQLGSKERVRSYLQMLRDQERDRFVVDVLKVVVEDYRKDLSFNKESIFGNNPAERVASLKEGDSDLNKVFQATMNDNSESNAGSAVTGAVSFEMYDELKDLNMLEFDDVPFIGSNFIVDQGKVMDGHNSPHSDLLCLDQNEINDLAVAPVDVPIMDQTYAQVDVKSMDQTYDEVEV